MTAYCAAGGHAFPVIDHETRRMVKLYCEYLADWAKARHRARFQWPDSFEQFRADVEAEEEQDARDHARHIRAMSSPHRYI